MQRVPGSILELGRGDGCVEAGAESVSANASSPFDEHEVGGTAVAAVRE